ncbi:CHASE3 domain-containing protein [Variovorax ginsengisoli]|uniref:Methyl-accepting chemotaxis protein n=1 Tax=Variovorax ginsengisoli TaxID=363844 RepID=A0ABT9SDI3_9BURK|nr:CHASE3 domain-containing protein [Variovorax ginsengisoli]MDP9902240.1 methyl-accepting chemotaxis protein [Variovorax ginsengisoli]
MNTTLPIPAVRRPDGLRRWWARCRRWGLPPKRVVTWSVISAVPMALIIALGAYLSYHGHSLLVESRRQVDHTHQVLAALHKLFISLEDAETGQRGFIITGDDSYLAPYSAAVEEMPASFATLRHLLDDSPAQATRLTTLEGLIRDKLDELGAVIVLRRTRGFQSASHSIVEGRGKLLMDEVRRETAEIGRAADALLVERQNISHRRERELLRIGVLVAALSIFTRIALAVVLSRLRRATTATAR